MPVLGWLVHFLYSNFRNKRAGFDIVANCMKTDDFFFFLLTVTIHWALMFKKPILTILHISYK